MSNEVLRAAARVARASKAAVHAEIIEARQELAVVKIAQAIERNLAAAPPLTGAQRQRLGEMLIGGTA